MHKVEKKMRTLGFTKLQEKEEKVFYESTVEMDRVVHQVCIVYDKHHRKISSFDTYAITEHGMTIEKNDPFFENLLKKELALVKAN